jgi:aminoglycoside phosphotransferase (APT) family kinase protein
MTPPDGRSPATILPEAVAARLTELEGASVELLQIGSIAEDRAEGELKQIGYGEPVLVRYRVRGAEKRCVLHTMSPNWFGHDRRSDRAALVLLAADTFDQVPRHTRVLDVGTVDARGGLVSLRGDGEFWLLTEYADGTLYARDLRAIEVRGSAEPRDLARAEALAAYLAELHREPLAAPPELYQRALRDAVGSGEGIFGIVDSYPVGGPVAIDRLARFEQRAVAYRARLRGRTSRLRRTHGDFHPYNLLFREGVDFTVLDASRGGVGDPADDLAALTLNYVFGALVHPSARRDGFEPLWTAFWTRYLALRDDREVLEVVPLFFAWRALIVASPVWYPTLEPSDRDALLTFAERLLDDGHCDPSVIAAS